MIDKLKPDRLYRGDTMRRAWIIRDSDKAPIDLTGVTARVHIRDADGALRIAASTADGRITITPLEGRIDMLVEYPITAIEPGSYRYDLEVTHADGTRQTYAQRVLIIYEDMSRG